MLTNRKYRALCTIFLLVLLSCNKDSERREEVFYLNLTGGLASADPAFAKDLSTMWVSHMLYNTLVETDETLQIIPSLAKSWQVSEDGLTYTFNIRSGVRFHDNEIFSNGEGREMTAHDVVYSFNRLMDPKTASTGAWVFNDRVAEVQPFTAPNDTTVVIKLKTPFAPFLQMLSMPYCSVVPKEVAEHRGKDFRRYPCGTGPFRFDEWDEGNVMILKKNEHYWEADSAGNKLPYLSAVQISFYDSKAQEFLLFMQGKLDFVNGIDGSFKDLVMSKNGELKEEFARKFDLKKGTYLNTEYLGFLTDTTSEIMRNSPVKNILVRKAINYGIDRNKIVTYFRNGVGIPATSGFIPAGMPGYDSSGNYGYTYNPEKSLQLLAEAGYPNGKGLPPISVLTPDNYSDLVNFVAAQLQDVGIKVQVEIIQPALLKEQMSKSQAVFFRAMWIADYPDAETYLAFFNSRFPAPPNYTRFNNPLFDKWYDVAMQSPDSIRQIYYRKMDSLAITQAAVVPLFYDQMLHFTQQNVSGLTANPMNLIDLKKVRKK